MTLRCQFTSRTRYSTATMNLHGMNAVTVVWGAVGVACRLIGEAMARDRTDRKPKAEPNLVIVMVWYMSVKRH